jgi:hypothetical protein
MNDQIERAVSMGFGAEYREHIDRARENDVPCYAFDVWLAQELMRARASIEKLQAIVTQKCADEAAALSALANKTDDNAKSG